MIARFALAALLVTGGCSFEQLTRRDGVELVPESLAITAQPGEAIVAAPLLRPPAVAVRNLDDEPLRDTTLVVRVTSSEGSDILTGAEARVNADGVAVFTALRIVGRVSPSPMRRLTFTLVDHPKVGPVISAELPLVVGTPRIIDAVSALSQTGKTMESVAAPPTVLVRDIAGNPVAVAAVRFRVLEGVSWVRDTAVRTDTAGKATAGAWTPGVAGTHRVRAVLADGGETSAPVIFAATVAATMGKAWLHVRGAPTTQVLTLLDRTTGFSTRQVVPQDSILVDLPLGTYEVTGDSISVVDGVARVWFPDSVAHVVVAATGAPQRAIVSYREYVWWKVAVRGVPDTLGATHSVIRLDPIGIAAPPVRVTVPIRRVAPGARGGDTLVTRIPIGSYRVRPEPVMTTLARFDGVAEVPGGCYADANYVLEADARAAAPWYAITTPVCYAVQTARLIVSITGLPDGRVVRLALAGPGGRNATLDAVAARWTSTLPLEPGTWTISAPPVVVNGTTHLPQPASIVFPLNAAIHGSVLTIQYAPQ